MNRRWTTSRGADKGALRQELMKRRSAAIAAIAVMSVLASIALASLTAGELLTRPANHSIGPPPVDLSVEAIRLSSDGGVVAGWLSRVEGARGSVLLLHGLRSDRTQMLARARFLTKAGYTVLLVDLPAHGESSGDRITFGAREATAVHAALSFMRGALPNEPIAILGVSLGAASAVLAGPSPAPAAMILESMYPTIDEAVHNRLAMRIGPLASALSPLLLWQLPLRLGLHPSELRPIDGIAAYRGAVLVASGSDDLHTTWAETQRIAEAACGPKLLWRVEGAAHVDLHAHAPREYEQTVLHFLDAYLD